MKHTDIAKLCEQSYTKDGDFQYFFSDRGDVDGFFSEEHNSLIFTGTNSLWEWFKNLWRWRTRGIHTGFYEGYKELRWKFSDLVKGKRAITVAGHSLGGAHAVQFAMEHPGYVKEVVLFGSPRVYSFAMSKIYKKLLGDVTTRYVFVDDFVPWIPVFGYSHVCPATYLHWRFWGKDLHDISRYVRALS